MENKCVSIFVGIMSCEDEFYNYTEFKFNEDAPDDEYDGYECDFCKDFGIDLNDVDEDFVEVAWKVRKYTPVELLEGCSYFESFRDEIVNKAEGDKAYNSAVLFYNYDYKRKRGTVKSGFTYLGTYAYEK